jgi:hypothetical protein
MASAILTGTWACGSKSSETKKGGEETQEKDSAEQKSKEAKAEAGSDLSKLVPAKADVAVFIQDWKKTLDALEVVDEKFGAIIPIEKTFEDFKRESGIDLRKDKSLTKRGLDPAGSIGVLFYKEHVLMALSLSDEKKFIKAMAKEAKEDDDIDDKVKKKKVGDSTIWFLLKDAEEEPEGRNIKVAYTIKDKTAIIMPGGGPNKGDVKVLEKIIKLKESKSLSKNDAYKSLNKSLGEGRLVYAYVNAASLLKAEAKRSNDDTLKTIAERTTWVGAGISMSEKNLDARVFAMGDDKTVKSLSKILSSKADFEDLAGSIGPKPAFVIRTSLNLRQLLKEVTKLDEGIKKETKRGLNDFKAGAGIDIEKDILPHLVGDTTLAVYGGKAKDLVNGDIENLFTSGQAVASMGVKDAKKLNGTLQKIAEKMKAEAEKKDGVWVYRMTNGDKTALLVVGKKIALIAEKSAGEKKLIKWAKGKGAGVTGNYKKGVAGQLLSGKSGTGVAVDVKRLMKLAGDGAKGQQSEVLKRFKSWSVNLKPAEGGLQLDAEVLFK